MNNVETIVEKLKEQLIDDNGCFKQNDEFNKKFKDTFIKTNYIDVDYTQDSEFIKQFENSKKYIAEIKMRASIFSVEFIADDSVGVSYNFGQAIGRDLEELVLFGDKDSKRGSFLESMNGLNKIYEDYTTNILFISEDKKLDIKSDKDCKNTDVICELEYYVALVNDSDPKYKELM